MSRRCGQTAMQRCPLIATINSVKLFPQIALAFRTSHGSSQSGAGARRALRVRQFNICGWHFVTICRVSASPVQLWGAVKPRRRLRSPTFKRRRVERRLRGARSLSMTNRNRSLSAGKILGSAGPDPKRQPGNPKSCPRRFKKATKASSLLL
jgi:hypothetical protein